MKNETNIEYLRKIGQLEHESSYILAVYEDKVKYRHLKNIAYKIGSMISKYTLPIYAFIGIVSILLLEFNFNAVVLISLLLITLFLLDKCHQLYIKETKRIIESKITLVKNRFSKSKEL